MESCLHLWVHPQKLTAYVCLLSVFVCCSALTILPECSNKYSPQQIIAAQMMNRIKVCMCIVHEATHLFVVAHDVT